MTTDSNYYEVLGVASSADIDTIKRAYREQMRRFHPDSFVGLMAKARQSGDLRQIRALEKQIEESKQKTKQLNTAYAVLGDAAKRQAYDMRRGGVPQSRSAPYYPESDPYRSGPYAARDAANPMRQQAPRPPMPRPRQPNDSFPFALFAILGGGLMLAFASLFAFSNLPAPEDGIPRVNDGRISAQDLQATTSAQQATHVSMTRIAMQPTATPRTLEQEVLTGDTFAQRGQYALAVELYSNAINRGFDDTSVYFKRGKVYSQLGNDASLSLAFADFTYVIQQQPNDAAAYLERALVQFALWQRNGDPILIENIRADAARYTELGGAEDARLVGVLEALE